MITITARTSKKFFGEPLYLGELAKGLTAAALGIDRGEFRFVHTKNTDESPEADIDLSIDAVGNESVANELESALQAVMSSWSRLTFAISFTGGTIDSDAQIFGTTTALGEAVESARSDLKGMAAAHMRSGYTYGDYAGESGEYYDWMYNKILNEK